MKKELTTEELRKYPLISLPLRRQKYDEVIKRIETAYNEGKTVDRAIEELVQGVIVRIIDKQDVIDYYKERDREKQIKENGLKTQITRDTDMQNGDVSQAQVSQSRPTELEIADEDLEDWEKQDFPMYDEEEKEAMKQSIVINGIMERLIVRPIKDKPRKISDIVWS